MLACTKAIGGFVLLSMIMPAQTNQRFPAPLGIDRILTGVVIDCTKPQSIKSKRDPACGEKNGYVLKVETTVYRLHGHEVELAKHSGDTTTITGNVVENDVKVTSVRASKK